MVVLHSSQCVYIRQHQVALFVGLAGLLGYLSLVLLAVLG